MSLVILPLCEGPLTLSGILLFVEQLVEYLHGLLVRNDSTAIELVFSVPEPNDVVHSTFATVYSLALTLDTDHGILLLQLMDELVFLVFLNRSICLLISLARALSR